MLSLLPIFTVAVATVQVALTLCHAPPREPAPIEDLFAITACTPPTVAGIADQLRADFVPTFTTADLEELVCVHPYGFQVFEIDIALLRAGTQIDPGPARPLTGGGEAAMVLRNVFQSRPDLQPAEVAKWFVDFGPANNFRGIAEYKDGRIAVIYYRD